MEISLPSSWEKALQDEWNKSYFQNLKAFVDAEYSAKRCFPPQKEIFNAFRLTPFEEVKVVLLGQDPYHGLGQAHGLCFSVNDGISFPPSLINIFKEIESDIGEPIPITGNLTRWAEQGVLLLNATLTVEEAKAGSHQKKGWETFTDTVIHTLSNERENLVFMLWGGYAKKKINLIDNNKHLVLISGHPSPLSANRGHWFGNKHFSMCNQFLTEKGKEPIQW